MEHNYGSDDYDNDDEALILGMMTLDYFKVEWLFDIRGNIKVLLRFYGVLFS